MESELWSAVDTWFSDQMIGADDVLEHALASSEQAGLPAINVSPAMGKLLQILVRIRGARNVLEIGTLGGYSSIWMARALPSDGRLITLEINPETANIARRNIHYAGLDGLIEVRTGRAIDTLREISSEGLSPFDFVFIDADKRGNPGYFESALELTRPGSVIIIDNIVRKGRVIDQAETDADILGARRVTELVAAEPRVTATAIQTVGIKGHDGFLIALVVPA